MTKQELREYTRLDIELNRLEAKIDELESRITSPRITKLSGMPRSGSQTDFTGLIDKLVDLKEMYNKKWDKLIDEQKRIETAICELDDPVERALMGYKYIDGLTWEEVAVKISYSWRWVHKLHARALEHLK